MKKFLNFIDKIQTPIMFVALALFIIDCQKYSTAIAAIIIVTILISFILFGYTMYKMHKGEIHYVDQNK